MAKAQMMMPENFLDRLSKLGSQSDAIAEKVLEAGGKVVLAKVQSNLSSVIGRGTKYDSRSTGELERSIGLSPAKLDRDGNHNVKIGFVDPRSDGDSNAKIANILEYGKHGQPAKPFLKPAKRASKSACEETIDTLGNRYRELILPIPKDQALKTELIASMRSALETRMKYKAAVKQMPLLIEKVLEANAVTPFDEFFNVPLENMLTEIVQDTTTLEFGEFSAYKMKRSDIIGGIFLPKYYDPSIKSTLDSLAENCSLYSVQQLIDMGAVQLSTGDEIGKMAYGTGEIPFVRTSDFSNWEIKADAKQGISEEIYQQYAEKEDVQEGDILLVRDGTYLVGTSCMITVLDTKMLYCGGLIKIRALKKEIVDEYLLLGLLNSYIVKRQIRTKQFTRDVIDTLGQRLKEVIIPIPNSEELKKAISEKVHTIVNNRIQARDIIQALSDRIVL